jgi:hypothetical protein
MSVSRLSDSVQLYIPLNFGRTNVLLPKGKIHECRMAREEHPGGFVDNDYPPVLEQDVERMRDFHLCSR